MELKNLYAQDTSGNAIESPTVSVYLAGTSTLATGLLDYNSMPMPNPFTASQIGHIQFAATPGDYDVRVTKDHFDHRVRVRFIGPLDTGTDTSRAPLASPAFTGTPTAPTAAAGTNTTQLATTAFVQAEILADASPISHMGSTGTAHGVATQAVAGFMSSADKSKLDGVAAGASANGSTAPSMNGAAASGTAATSARSDHVHPTDTSRAPLASPAFTGTPTAPTAAAGTNTTQLATTAFVRKELESIGSTSASTKLRIGVLGDSLTAQADFLHEPWPSLLQRTLITGGLECEVHNLAVIGYTFNDANTTPTFGGKTPVQRAIDLKCDVVIVALGANDTITGEARTITQVKADAAAVFSALRTGLPNAKLIYGSELTWDIANKPAGTGVRNIDVTTFLWNLPISGPAANAYAEEILDNPVSTAISARFPRWLELDAYVKALTTINGAFTLDHFKCARLGLVGQDGVHLTAEGANFFCGWARKAFTTLPSLKALAPSLRVTNYPAYDDPDTVFGLFCQSSGGTWIDKPLDSVAGHISTQHLMIRGIRPSRWYLPTKGDVVPSHSETIGAGGVLSISVASCLPSTAVEIAPDGTAYTATGTITDAAGNAVWSLPASQALSGTHLWRIRVGNEVYGPWSINIDTTAPGNVTGPASASGDAIALFDGATGKLLKSSGVQLSAKQDKLVSGSNIKTINGASLLGSGNLTVGGLAASIGDWSASNSQSTSTSGIAIQWSIQKGPPAGVSVSGSAITLEAGAIFHIHAHALVSGGTAGTVHHIRIGSSINASEVICGSGNSYSNPFIGLEVSTIIVGTGSPIYVWVISSTSATVATTDSLTRLRITRLS